MTAAPALDIQVTPEFEGIAVHINGVLHLWLDRPRLLGISSWVKTGRRQFFIEFVMAGGNITTDYDTREKWETILKQLEGVLLSGRLAGNRECP